MRLGDRVSKALAAVGVTPEAVTRLVGRDCGCKDRAERLNALGWWAERTLRTADEKAREYLDRMIQGWEDGRGG